jgi:hypothetical protein
MLALIAADRFGRFQRALANGARADACGFGNGLWRLPARHLPHDPLST